jgi:uncharacterized repeat protein (TIGR01451 family)
LYLDLDLDLELNRLCCCSWSKDRLIEHCNLISFAWFTVKWIAVSTHCLHFVGEKMKKLCLICISLIIYICTISSSAFAGWGLNGDAYVSGDRVVLTPELNDQAGSAWIDTRIDLSNDFDISFQIYLGDNDGSGADGISFALHNDSRGTAAFGETSGGGEWIGMNGICPSVSVEVDTYQNGSRGDLAADHVGINVLTGNSGFCSGQPDHGGSGPIQASTSSANIEDGMEHELRITWDVSTYTMDVYFDGNHRTTYSNNILANVFSGSPLVYLGFTASTGGAYNLQYIIPNSAAVDATISATPNVFLKSDPNKEITYTIEVVNDGAVTAFGTNIQATLPPGFSYVSGSTIGAATQNPVIDTSDPDHEVLSWNLTATPIPPAGGTSSISFKAKLQDVVGTFRTDFSVTGDNFNQISRTQTATVIVGPTDLEIHKNHIGTFVEGTNGIYEIVISNSGPDEETTPVVVTDSLPVGMSYVSSSGTGWIVDDAAAPLITWTHAGPLAAGTSLPALNVTVLPNSGAVPSVTNTATVTATPNDMDSSNNSDSDSTTVLGVGAGNKPLYVSDVDLSRTPPTGIPVRVRLNGDGASQTWPLTPVLASDLTVASGPHPVRLWLLRSRRGVSRTVTVQLTSAGTTTGNIGSPDTQTFTIPSGNAGITEIIFNINLTAPMTLSSGSRIEMTVTNETSGGVNLRIFVIPVQGTEYSRVDLNSDTVISITNLNVYNAVYPGGTIPAQFLPGDMVYVRADVSDPFGSHDITGCQIDIIDPSGITRVSGAVMNMEFDSAGAVKIYEYGYDTTSLPLGVWTARVTAMEGTENMVTDVLTTSFVIQTPLPDLIVLKSVQAYSDPVNSTTFPKSIPGALMNYTIQVTNNGDGTTGADTVEIIDSIPSTTEFYADDIGGGGSGPVGFSDNATVSGLSYSFTSLADTTDDISFSDNNGTTYVYIPVPDGDGFDGNVTNLKINPKGTFSATSGGNTPGCSFLYRVKIK